MTITVDDNTQIVVMGIMADKLLRDGIDGKDLRACLLFIDRVSLRMNDFVCDEKNGL